MDRGFRWMAVGMVMAGLWATAFGQEASSDKPFRIGMIGLDTSHVVAFSDIFHSAKEPDELAKFRVVAAFKGGSPDLQKDSMDRIPNHTKILVEKHKVKIYDSIEEMCKNVDGVMLESVDGRPHLKQAIPVIQAGLPLFIDKPMGGSLKDVIEIFRLAKEANVPVWSASSLRYDTAVVEMREKIKNMKVKKVITWGPCHHEPHHPDLFWYGVHGVEMLFTLMGPGCKSIVRTENTDIVTGTWADGRIGVYDPTRKDYGMEVITEDETLKSGIKSDFYRKEMQQVAKFFTTKKAPLDPAITIELFAFMQAADVSKEQGWKEVSLADVIEKAKAGR